MSPRRGLDLSTIIEAAAGMADRDGIEAVTLASLAAELGIRSPSLYNHVNGLNGLKIELAIYGLQLLTGAITEALEGKSGDEAMHAVGAAYIAFARRHPGLYELTLKEPDDGHERYESIASQLVELLVRTIRQYELDRDTAIHALRGFRSFLHGFASIEQKGGFGMPYAVDESMRMVMQAYLIGLRQLSK